MYTQWAGNEIKACGEIVKNLALFYVFFTCNRVALCGAVQVRGERGGGGVVPLQVRGICLQRND